MAISNYGTLKTAIESFQYGAGSLTTQAADLVTLAQGYLNRRLRTRHQVTQVEITPDPATFLHPLPDDFLQVRHVAELASYRRKLTYIALDAADTLYPYREDGLGVHYTIIGSNIEVFPATSNDIELTYYAALGAFSDDDQTDWLLTKMPGLYLGAGQMYAAEFLKDDAELQKQATIVDMMIALLNAEDDGAEMADATYTPQGQVA